METLKKAWEWVKLNWKWLLFPIGAVLFILGKLSTSRQIVTLDPVVKADGRAKVEANRRKAEQAAEQELVRARLDAVRSEHQDKIRVLSEQQMDEAAELEGDPEKLNDWLKSL